MSRPFEQFEDTPLWRSLADALAELEASKELALATAPAYVIGFLCERLTAARLTVPDALGYDPRGSARDVRGDRRA